MAALLMVDDVIELTGDEKSPCGLCKKPVAVLYKIRLDEGGAFAVCRSDLHRVLSMQAQTRKNVAEAEPLFNGSDRKK